MNVFKQIYVSHFELVEGGAKRFSTRVLMYFLMLMCLIICCIAEYCRATMEHQYTKIKARHLVIVFNNSITIQVSMRTCQQALLEIELQN